MLRNGDTFSTGTRQGIENPSLIGRGSTSNEPSPQIKLDLFNKIIRCKCNDLSRIEKSFLKGVIIIGLGGFVLGYDVSIVAGGLENMNQHFHFNTYESSMFVASLSLGAALGSIFAGPLSDSIGRWKICQLQALLFILGSSLVATAQHFALLIVGRLIVGIGTAFAIIGSLSYLNEISPLKYSGRFQGAFELFGALGMFIATAVNIFSYENDAAKSWRIAFGITIFVGACQSVLLFLLPESPSFLVQKGRFDDAHDALEHILVDPEIVHAELESLKLENMTKVTGRFETFKKAIAMYSPSLYTILGFVLFQALSGGIVFASYGPSVFSHLGFSLNSGLLATLALGAIRILSTIFAIFRIDSRRWGRLTLLKIGIFTMFVGYICFIITWFLCDNKKVIASKATFTFFFLSLCIVVIGNAIGFGPVSKVLQSEMFPTLIKSRGMAASLFVQSIFQFAILFTFPVGMHHIHDDIFIFVFYGFFTLVSFVYVILLVPETLSSPPTQILQSIQKNAQKVACLKSKGKASKTAIQQGLQAPINDFVVDYEVQNNEYTGNNDTRGYIPPSPYGNNVRRNPMNLSIDSERSHSGVGNVDYGDDGWKTGHNIEMVDSDDFVS